VKRHPHLDGLAERVVNADSATGAHPAEAAESLHDITQRLARRFASRGARSAGSAAAATGAIAAGLLEWTAALSALSGPDGFRRPARSIASRGAALQSALSSEARADAELVGRWERTLREGRGVEPEKPASSPEALDAATASALDIAARCAQVTTLAAEVARDGYTAVRHHAEAALRLGTSAADCALTLAEESFRAAAETDSARNAKRRIWRTRLLLRRVRSVVEDVDSV
jgi:hypothetical protein